MPKHFEMLGPLFRDCVRIYESRRGSLLLWVWGIPLIIRVHQSQCCRAELEQDRMRGRTVLSAPVR